MIERTRLIGNCMNFPTRKTQREVMSANSPLTSLLLSFLFVDVGLPTRLICVHFAHNSLVVHVALLLSLSFGLKLLLAGVVEGRPKLARLRQEVALALRLVCLTFPLPLPEVFDEENVG